MTRKQALKKGFFFILTILVLTAPLIYLQKTIGADRIRSFINSAGVWGPVVYIAIRLVTHIIAPISGTPVILAGIAVFGKWTVIYDYLVGAISGVTNFWISRKLGRDIVVKVVGHQAIEKIDHLSTHEGVKALILMRLFYGAFVDFVSYAAGLTAIRFRTYYLITLLASLPWTIGTFWLFNLVPQSQVILVSVVGSVLFVVVPPTHYYLKHRFDRNKITHLH